MRLLTALLFAPLLIFLAACEVPIVEGESTPRTIAPILTSEQAFDDQTYARPQEARVTHLDLDLAVDFDAKTIGGTATLDMLAAEGADEVLRHLDDAAAAGATQSSPQRPEGRKQDGAEGRDELHPAMRAGPLLRAHHFGMHGTGPG